MSAPFNGTKTRVVGFFKGLFGKAESQESTEQRDDVTYNYYDSTPVTGAQLKSPAAVRPATPAIQARVVPTAAPAPATAAKITSQSPLQVATKSPQTLQPAVAPISARMNQGSGNVTAPAIQVAPAIKLQPQTPAVAETPKPAAQTPSTKLVNMSLAAVVASLPQELQGRVVRKNFGEQKVGLPMEQVVSQLASGVVKIAFGCIREAAPQFFTPTDDADHLLVALPLAEVFKQINPSQLAKPANQVRLTAEAEVESPFADKGNHERYEVKGSAPMRVATSEPIAPVAQRSPTAETAKPLTQASPSAPQVRINMPAATPTPKPTPVALTTQSKAPALKVETPNPAARLEVPIAKPEPKPATAANGNSQPSPTPSLQLAASPAPAKTPSQPAPTAQPKPQAEPARATATPAAPAPQIKTPSLSVALRSLMETWPGPIKDEVLSHELLNANVELPIESVAEQLKTGRVVFTWDSIRSWLTPSPRQSTALGGQSLDLPLKVVAPLFLGLKPGEPAKANRLVADENIPDVFAQFSKPGAAPASAAKPTQTVPTQSPVDGSPEGIIARAAALKGVSGAVIALPDGLLVASKLPKGFNGESLAAFLPQIAAKLDASMKALGMEEVTKLNFSAGTVPWSVIRTSKVIFAAFGSENTTLPGEALAALALELEKH